MPAIRDFWHDFFIVPENVLPARAVRRLAKAMPDAIRISRPLVVVHGPTGCGKSMLAAAAKAEAGEHATVVFAKDLARGEIVDAMIVPFLILEDVHRVDADQAERIVTMLDARVARGKPTVVTSNAAPAELTHLPNRLTNRLAGGLVLGFRPFSDASRARMAMRIAKRGGRTLTKAKARTIAKAKPGSLRKIEAAVQEEFLTYAPPASKSKRPRMPNRDALARLEELAVRVAKAFQTTPEELRSRAQSWHLATVRQTFTRLAYRHLGIAYTQIEGFLGRKGMAMSGPLLDAKLMKDAKLKLLFERLEAETGKPIRK